MVKQNAASCGSPCMQSARLNRTNSPICAVEQDVFQIGVRYHDIVKRMETIRKGFAQRLFALRAAKGVSAREMSLSLGQGSGYISNLENQHNLPSMAQFFAICEYLGVMPSVFFSFGFPSGEALEELMIAAQALDQDDLALVLALAQRLQREDVDDGCH